MHDSDTARISEAAGIFSIFVGSVVFVGWALHIDIFKSFLPGLATMKANSAICFILAGESLRQIAKMKGRKFSHSPGLVLIRKLWTASALAIVALLTLSQYLFGWNLGIDELLFRDSPISSEALYAGRMGLNTALNFLLLSGALWLLGLEGRGGKSRKGSNSFLSSPFPHSPFPLPPSPFPLPSYLLQILSLIVGLIALQALVGYIYGVRVFYQFSIYTTSMAIHTALTFVVLSVGVLLANSNRGFMETVDSNLYGGVVARRLMPSAIALPLALGWLILLGVRANYFDTAFGLSLLAVSFSVIFIILIWHSARFLNKMDSKRRKAESDLHNSEAQLRIALEFSQAGVYEWNLLQNQMQWSKEYCILFGLDPSYPASYEHWLSSIHPEDRDRVNGEITTALQRQADLDLEYRILHPKGERWINGRGKAFYNEEGEAVRMLGICLDITPRKQAEIALRETESRFRVIVNSIEDVFWMSGPKNDQLIYISPVYEEIWGRSCESLQANPGEWINGIHPDDRLRVEESFLTQVDRGKYDEEFRVVRPDGSIRWVRDRGYAVKNDSGEVYCVSGIAQDITERKQAEVALHQNMAIVNAINEFTPSLIFVKDRQGALILGNPAFFNAIGKTEAEAMGKTDAEFLDNRNEAFAVMENDSLVMGNGEVQVFEETVKLPEGTRTFLSSKSPYRDQTGNIIGVIGIATDITERKQTEAILLQSEQRYRALIENAPDAVFITNIEGMFTDVNMRACEMLGYEREELIKLKITDIIPSEDVRRVLAARKSLLKGDTQTQEWVHICKDGTRFPVEVSAKILPDGNWQAFVRDISERKQAKAALIESEERYRVLAENIPQLVWINRPDGFVEYFNQRWLNYTGLEPNENLGWDWQQVLHPDDAPQAMNQWTAGLNRGEPIEVQYRLKRVDGVYCWHMVQASPLKDKSGNIIKWFSTGTDIDERIRAQAALRQTEQRLRLLLDSDLIGILFGDVYGRVDEANDAFLEIIGYSREDLAADRISWTDITPPEYLPSDDIGIAEAQARGTCIPYEKEYIRKDGSRIWVLLGYTLLGEKTGKFGSVYFGY